MNRLIHWSEGMYVSAQSLQGLQHGLLERIHAAQGRGLHFPYGVVELELSRADLGIGLVRFNRLHVVFENGWEVRIPEECDLPSLRIPPEACGKEPVFVYLALPLHQSERGNATEPGEGFDYRVKLLYRPCEELRLDENSGGNRQPVMVRQLNARLLLATGLPDKSAAADLVCLRVARLSCTRDGTDTVRADPVPGFAPPCLYLHEQASLELRERGEALLRKIDRSRVALSKRLVSDKFSPDAPQGAQFIQLLRLRSLSRAEARLTDLLGARQVTPFEVFLTTHELVADLESFLSVATAEERRPLTYDHDEPHRSFELLHRRLDVALRDAEGLNYLSADFVADDSGESATVTLRPEHFGSEVTGYFLGITTTIDPHHLRNLVESGERFELTSRQRIGTNYGGMRLAFEERPPDIPLRNNLRYFRILHSGAQLRRLEKEIWNQIRGELAMSVTRRNPDLDLSEAQFTLYMTLASREGEHDPA